MSTALRAAYALFFMLGAISGAQAEERAKARIERANSGTISVIASSLETPYLNYAEDLADVLDDGDNLRILPIIGKGPVQTLTDLIYLKGIDAGIVPSDVLAYVRANKLYEEDKISYLAKFGSAQVHLVARREFTELGQLSGKRINIGRATDDRFVTASVILNDAAVSFTADDSDPATALAMLKSGKLDAVFLVEQHPSPYLANIQAADGLALVPVPLTGNLKSIYTPALLTSSEYPELLGASGAIESVSVSWVLAVFNWRKGTERYDKLVKLAQALYSQIDLLRMPNRHAPWGEVNLAAGVPGWQRYIAAEEWLAGKLPKPETADEEPVASQADFKAFLAESGLPADTTEGGEDALFERFVKWQQARGEEPNKQ
jgi:TRAP-type uncharacterized transport system substrate-binding protein